MSWLNGGLPNTYKKGYNECGDTYFVHEASSISNLTYVGAYTYIHGKTRCVGSEKISIGKFCSIATNVTIHAGDDHNLFAVSTYPFKTITGIDAFEYHEVIGKSVSIGNDVWIGEGAQILSGSEIGSGAIIGAGCVVKGKVEPYSIMVGNPSICKRLRCKPGLSSFLLDLAWWDWSIARIQRNHAFFSLPLNVLENMSWADLNNLIVE